MTNTQPNVGTTVEFFANLGRGRMALASGVVVNRDGDHLFVREPSGAEHYIFTDEVEGIFA